MNLRLALAGMFLPRSLRKRELLGLVALTAEAFGAPVPDLSRLPFDGILDGYARWTEGRAVALRRSGTPAGPVRARMSDLARGLGARLRDRLKVRTRADVMKAGRLIYRLLGIELRGTAAGDIVVDRCSFGRTYTPETCALMSALDEGLFVGLSGGGSLEFSARITEGRPACRARFAFPPELP